ncbi:MAG: M56 family metallopeptidase [Vicinamibacterales bacterium]
MTEWLSFDVLAHLWQSTLVIGVVWLLTLALRGNRAHVRHRLWLAASVKFLVPFSWFVSLGAQVEWRTAPSLAQPAATFVMEEILAPPVIAAVVSTPTAQSTLPWPWMLASIWAVGFAGVLFWWWRQWRLVQAALGQAKPIAPGSACDVADLTVMSSAWTFEPGVIGIWRPVLLLPEGLADRLTPAQLNAIIAHERCHVGRHDNLAAAAHMVVEAMFWFHPLVWWIERRMLDERERACDEAVLSAGNDPDEYVAGILSVCRFTLQAPLACVAGVSGAELRTRIESIVRMELGTRMTVTRRVAVALVAAVLLGVPIVAGLVGTPVVVAAFAPAGRVPLLQIQDPPRQSFEVASVKPNKSGETSNFLQRRPGGNFAVGNMTLRGLIMFAYGIQGFQLVGAPDWVATERFDITARAAADIPPTPMGQLSPEALMLRSLLEDRFRLSAHRETRDLPIYALVLARADGRLGPRLRQTTSDYCKKLFEAAGKAGNTPVPPGGPVCGMRPLGSDELAAGALPMNEFARFLNVESGRTVVDRTGLTGLWDFDLKWSRPNAPNPDPDRPSIFTALQEQLGLRLDATTGPVEVLVIDRVEPLIPD